MTPRYSLVIQWSDEDQAYVVTFPEFGGCMTHGDTYEEAAKHGREVLESFIDIYQTDGRPLPDPLTLGMPVSVQPEQAPARGIQ